MDKNLLEIKNMFCDRCKAAVSSILKSQKVPFKSVNLGEVVLLRSLERREEEQLEQEFSKAGFKLLKDRNERTVNRIKSITIEEIYQSQAEPDRKHSKVLAGVLAHDYIRLNSLFKKMEGITIEKYSTSLKIERTKELLEYGELNIDEIAASIGFNSVIDLCAEFEKETGLSPAVYQKNNIRDRRGIDKL